MIAADAKKGYSVVIIDRFHFMNEDEEIIKSGFPTLEAARDYARRVTRDSVEGFREQSKSESDLRELWSMFGEDGLVIGDGYAGSSELDFFISNPAKAKE
jgi:hypothetical protein